MTDDDFTKNVSVVGIGGTLRPGSSTEQAVRAVLRHAAAAGATVSMYSGPSLNFPMYVHGKSDLSDGIVEFIDALRNADAIVLGSPAYHGGISGLIKNALDYTEEMATDDATYFDGRAVGCVASGAGWQGANGTVNALRNVVHSLRGWPTPLGIALNSREPLFDSEGEALKPEIDNQFFIMARQLVEFAATRRYAKGKAGTIWQRL
jgi:FMN reductase